MSVLKSILITILIAWPMMAHAQSDEKLAIQFYKLGEELFNRSDYEGALKQFQQSYQYSNKPALLFNMARCHESLGQYEKAIERYSEYLQSKPDNADVIETRIANLKKLLQKKQAKPEPQAPPASQPTLKEPAQDISASASQPLSPPEPPKPHRPLRWPGWILTGAGTALIVTGIAMGFMASGKQSELEDANAAHKDWADYQDLEKEGQTYEKAQIATLTVGGVAAATGVVLLILDGMGKFRGEHQAYLGPTLLPSGGGLTGSFRF